MKIIVQFLALIKIDLNNKFRLELISPTDQKLMFGKVVGAVPSHTQALEVNLEAVLELAWN